MKVKEAREMCEKWRRLYRNLDRLEVMAVSDDEGERLARQVEEKANPDTTFLKIMQEAKEVMKTNLQVLQKRIDDAEV